MLKQCAYCGHSEGNTRRLDSLEGGVLSSILFQKQKQKSKSVLIDLTMGQIHKGFCACFSNADVTRTCVCEVRLSPHCRCI